MENIYVIKVKTKPSLSSLYPSERRYSASTVGGLSFVHFGLGALSLFLGTLALSLQGPVLSVACLCPFATGLLAWKRWYIDRNITFFFYANIFSLLVGTLCFVVTVSDIAAISENGKTSVWSLEGMLDSPDDLLSRRKTLPTNDSLEETTSLIDCARESSQEAIDESLETFTASNIPEEIFREPEDTAEASTNFDFENQGFKDFAGGSLNYDDLKAEASVVYQGNHPTPIQYEGNPNDLEIQNETDRSPETIESKILSYWRDDTLRSTHTKILLNANVVIASLLEILWSLLSARIAFRGMQNRLVETSYDHNVVTGSKLRGKMLQKKKAPAPKPDILVHEQKFSESLQNLNGIENLQGLGPSLPLPESNREFRERVERFLANQAVHRVVEGSTG